jgi:hypothetical protein
MKKFIMLLLITLVVASCAHKKERIDQARVEYARFLYEQKRHLSRREFYKFLQRELQKKQHELVALETLKQQQVSGLSMDEQREREMSDSSMGESQFSLMKSGHRIKLRDLNYQLSSVEKSIFDIRALMSEL